MGRARLSKTIGYPNSYDDARSLFAKDLRYSFGDVLEKMGDVAPAPAEKLASYEKAREQFSLVAQIDFNFRDVAKRIEAIGKKIEAAKAGGTAGTG